MSQSCLDKQASIKELFKDCKTPEAKYQKIIELGRKQPRLNSKDKVESNLVKGCQSQMYLCTTLCGDKVIFNTESDALISSGLATLLCKVYSDETPETILKCPPTYLEELGISESLSPNRANGLYSLHLRMKQDALRLCTDKGCCC